MSNDVVTLRGVEVFAHHGVFDEERAVGQTFVIDVVASIDLESAAGSDDLHDTLDYGQLVSAIHERVSSEQWNLIERVAERVAELVLDDERITQVAVTIHKPEAPIAVTSTDISVSITRARK